MDDRALRSKALAALWGLLCFGAVPWQGQLVATLPATGFVALTGGLVVAAAVRWALGRWLRLSRTGPWITWARRCSLLAALAFWGLAAISEHLGESEIILPFAPLVAFSASVLGGLWMLSPSRPDNGDCLSVSCFEKTLFWLWVGAVMGAVWAVAPQWPWTRVVTAAGGAMSAMGVASVPEEKARQLILQGLLGTLLAGSLVRVAPYEELLPLLGAVAMVAGTAAGIGDVLLMRGRWSVKDGPTDAKRTYIDLSPYGFSDREVQAVTALMDGLTSDESAAVMGVKAATVRTYLHRASRKLGLSGGEELKSFLLDAATAGRRSADDSEDLTTTRCMGPWTLLLVMASPAALALLLLLPSTGALAPWSGGMPQALGAAWGLVLYSLVPRSEVFVLGQDPPAHRIARGFVWAIALTMAVAVSIATRGVTGSGPGPLSLLSIVALGLAVALSLVAFDRSIFEAGIVAPRYGRWGAIVAMLPAVTTVVLPSAWPFFTGLTCMLSVGARALGWWSAPRTAGSAEVPFRVPFIAAWAAVGFGAGAALECCWRSFAEVDLPLLAAPFVIGLWACMGGMAARLDGMWRRLALSCIGLGVVGGSVSLWLGFSRPFLVLADLTSLVALGIVAWRAWGQNGWATCRRMLTASVGMGMLVAFGGINLYGDTLGLNDVALGAVGGLPMAHGLPAFVAAAVTFLGLVGGVYAIRGAGRSWDQMGTGPGTETKETRVRIWLQEHGLNTLQCEVAYGIYANMNSSQLSEHLNYSRGYINNTRDAVYKCLDVHSRSELVDVITRGISL